MYVLTVEIEVEPTHLSEFKEAMQQQAKTSVDREDGCLTFDVWGSGEEPNRVLLYEIYRDKAAFEAHLEQPHSRTNGAKMKPWIRSQTIRYWNKLG